MDWLLRRLLLEARSRLRAGGLSRAWLIIGIGAWAARRLRNRESVVLTEVLRPGYRLELTELGPPPGRRERRRAGRQG